MDNKKKKKNVANIERLNNFANMTFLYGNRVNLNVSSLKGLQEDIKHLLAEREQDKKYIKNLELALEIVKSLLEEKNVGKLKEVMQRLKDINYGRG